MNTSVSVKNLINGELVDATGAKRFAVRAPATDAVIAEVPDCTEADFQRAVDAGATAFEAWAGRPAAERSAILARVVNLATAQTERLARTIAQESGKPLREAEGEVAYALGFLEWAAEEGKRTYGEIIPSSRSHQRIFVISQPVGVTAAITPWNFPLAMITRKMGPALAVGCTQVVKPAPQTPLSTIALAEIAVEAGVPPGVLNVVTGSAPRFADVIFGDPRVRKVSFTGSTRVGQELVRRSADNLTRLSLELGGSAPMIVLEDADLEVAVTQAVAAKFRNAGQSCIAAAHIHVARPLYESFCEALTAVVSAMRPGPWDDEADIGPLIDDAAVDKVRRHVDDAVVAGAKLLCGGHLVDLGDGFADRFFAPTLLADVNPKMLVCREETFGPVAGICAFDDVDEVVAEVNASPFGLAAYVAGRDVAQLLSVVERLEYGVIGVNDGAPSTVQAPFGGMKLSGIGREGGHYVMDEYLEKKYVSLVSMT